MSEQEELIALIDVALSDARRLLAEGRFEAAASAAWTAHEHGRATGWAMLDEAEVILEKCEQAEAEARQEARQRKRQSS